MNKIQKTLAVALASATLSLNMVPAWASVTHQSENKEHAVIGKPGEVDDATRTIEIKMLDNFYEPESISVKEGETIRFVISNAGDFVHEFNIGTAAMHAAHQKEMMTMAEHGILEADKINHEMMKMDMGEGKTMDHNDPNSLLLEPGKTGEVIWAFTNAGKIEFACNVPGHYDAGMMGNIRFNGSLHKGS